MSIEARREYLRAILVRYREANRRQKSIILDEFCSVCDYSRKHAIRILNGQARARMRKPGAKAKYGEEVIFHLVALWEATGRICSKKLKAALPLWLPYYKHESFTKVIEEMLLTMSPATMDRHLAHYRKKRGLTSTKASSWFKHKIPIELLTAPVDRPGFVEADTVAHCGNSLAGVFINSLTMTDLYSGWTENRAILGKSGADTQAAIEDIEKGLPFIMLGFASDNGTEFLNDNLYWYFVSRKRNPVKFVRRRPYKKNDAAHVEQKNYTHVRQLFGYDRLENKVVAEWMNEIYRVYWNPLLNYFTPSLKLESKIRVGGALKKKWEKPKTPYQRIIESQAVPDGIKLRLKEHFRCMNPFLLRQELDKKLKRFMELAEINKRLVA